MLKMYKTMCEIKQSAQPNVMELYIYDDVKSDSTDWWTGEVIESQTSANYIKTQLENAVDAKTINIYINSYGGSVKEGLAIYNQLKRHPAQKIAHIDGFACSIASVIAMAADKVIMGPNTLMMIHHASMCAYGNAEELRKAANDVEVIDGASCSSYLAKAGDKLTEQTLKELLDNQTWLNAEQCLQYGLADEITGKAVDTVVVATQRLEQAKQAEKARMMLLAQGEPAAHVDPEKTPAPEVKPEQVAPKTNADKIKALFKNKNSEVK